MATANNGAFGFGPNGPDVQSGAPLPNVPNGLPIPYPQPAANEEIRHSFMSPNLTAPYYNAAGVAGNLGTLTGQVAPNAANFMNQLFNPQLNQMEQNFMGASLGNALAGMNEGFNRQEGQYEGTPFHSGLPQAQGDVMEQMMRDMFQTGSQMGLQRQQIAASQAQFPFQFTAEAAQIPVQMAQGMFNQANTAFNAPYQIPSAVWGGYPVTAPATVVNQGGGKPF